jgi:integrase
MAGLMVFCGLRAGEVLALDVRDVDIDIGGRWLRVSDKGSKERRVPLDVDVARRHSDLSARRTSRRHPQRYVGQVGLVEIGLARLLALLQPGVVG